VSGKSGTATGAGRRASPGRDAVPARVVEWRDGVSRGMEDDVVGEEPLEIRVNGTPVSVTMRTPGHDAELAAGFLYTEGLVRAERDIARIGGPAGGNLVEVTLADEAPFDPVQLRRHFFASSSCGICGKATIEAVRARHLAPAGDAFRIDPAVLCGLPARLQGAQEVFARTGGLHASALFRSDGEVVAVREDVGRHNTVDKLVGWALCDRRLPLSNTGLLVSGRGGFEIVQKAIAAGIPLVASISAPSSLAVRLAREMRLTLVGFLRGHRFLVYSGEQRVRNDLRPGAGEARMAPLV
jgi:FdhD protein